MSVLGLGSNIASLKAQRRLQESTNTLSKTFERLSSGMRINSAGDDAAGLALSQSLRSDVRVFNQGVRNLNDGISLLNIADSAIESLTGIVVRLKELAEQSANGTYSNTQRRALDKEAQALSKEYFRIAQSTKFNDKSLFSSSFGTLSLQAGYGEGGSIASGLGGAVVTGTVGSSVTVSGTASKYALGDINGDGILDMLVSETAGVGVRLGTGNGSFANVTTYSTESTSTNVVQLADVSGNGILDMITGGHSAGGDHITIRLGNGDGTFAEAVSYASPYTVEAIAVGDINGNGQADIIFGGDGELFVWMNQGGGNFNFSSSIFTDIAEEKISLIDLDDDGILDLVIAGYNPSDPNIMVKKGNGDGTFQTGTSYGTSGDIYDFEIGDINNDGKLDIVARRNGNVSLLLGNGDTTFNNPTVLYTGTHLGLALGDVNGDGNLDIIDTTFTHTNIRLGGGDGTFSSATSYSNLIAGRDVLLADINNNGVLDIFGRSASGSSSTVAFMETAEGIGPLLPFSFKTIADARQALPIFSNKLDQLSSQRGKIGAFQSRASVAAGHLQNIADNYSAAASRITDADIAAETATLVRLQILQESSVAVLAQANLQPSLVLKLLGSDT